ncbi:hypothetical protein [Stenotrophomonas acidaminiphila]
MALKLAAVLEEAKSLACGHGGQTAIKQEATRRSALLCALPRGERPAGREMGRGDTDRKAGAQATPFGEPINDASCADGNGAHGRRCRVPIALKISVAVPADARP